MKTLIVPVALILMLAPTLRAQWQWTDWRKTLTINPAGGGQYEASANIPAQGPPSSFVNVKVAATGGHGGSYGNDNEELHCRVVDSNYNYCDAYVLESACRAGSCYAEHQSDGFNFSSGGLMSVFDQYRFTDPWYFTFSSGTAHVWYADPNQNGPGQE